MKIKMLISKQQFLLMMKQIEDLERRVKRLEVLLAHDAEEKIASLKNSETGVKDKDRFLTIEEILNQRCDG